MNDWVENYLKLRSQVASAKEHRALAEYVLDKHAKGLPENYQIYLTMITGNIARFIGDGNEIHEFDTG